MDGQVGGHMGLGRVKAKGSDRAGLGTGGLR